MTSDNEKMNTGPGENAPDLREESIGKIRRAVNNGLSFDQACSLVFIENKEFREAVVSEALKILIAEFHIFRGMPLKQLAMKLRLSMSRLLKEKESMDRDPEEARTIIQRAGIAGQTN